jgi:hypothetical protein
MERLVQANFANAAQYHLQSYILQVFMPELGLPPINLCEEMGMAYLTELGGLRAD